MVGMPFLPPVLVLGSHVQLLQCLHRFSRLVPISTSNNDVMDVHVMDEVLLVFHPDLLKKMEKTNKQKTHYHYEQVFISMQSFWVNDQQLLSASNNTDVSNSIKQINKNYELRVRTSQEILVS